MNDRFKLFGQPQFNAPTLLVAWNEDVSGIGSRLSDQLMRRLPYQRLAEIEPADFFPLAGITVEDNIVQFPESRFYWCPERELIIFKSDPPVFEWYRFLDLVLEIAQETWHIKEMYAAGGMVSLAAHTTPRQLLAVFNSEELKASLGQYDLSVDMDYKTPPGQRPTLNSFLLWTARRRNVPAANLWVPTPFYLLSTTDPSGERKALDFLSRRCGLRLDLADLDEETRRQAERIAELRSQLPEVDQAINKLESNQGLTEEDNEKLLKAMEELFKA